MPLVELIMLAIPSGFLFAMGLATLAMLGIIIQRYRYICVTRWEWLVVLIGFAGVVVFDGFVLLSTAITGWVDPVLGAAISRVMRLILLSSMFWVLHASGRRQREAWKIEEEILNGGNS